MGDRFLEHQVPRSGLGGGAGRNAEEAGFESLWAPEHIVVPGSADRSTRRRPRGGWTGWSHERDPGPIVWFAYVAARTQSGCASGRAW